MKKGKSKYQLETGIEIPSKNIIGRFPVDEMKVGQSFLIPEEELSELKPTSIRNAVRNYGDDNKKRFVIKRQTDGLRVWRTE